MLKKLKRTVVYAAFLCASTPNYGLTSEPPTVWEMVAHERNQDPKLLLAIALQESKHFVREGGVAPHPYAINLDGVAYFPKTLDEAKNILAGLDRCHNVDIGLMQINLKWHCNKVKSAEDLLNPYLNLQVGSEILYEAQKSTPQDLILGLGRYHHWSDEKIARAYGENVYSIYKRLRPFNFKRVRQNVQKSETTN